MIHVFISLYTLVAVHAAENPRRPAFPTYPATVAEKAAVIGRVGKCATRNVEVESVNLSNSAQLPQLVASCKSDCGQGGCPYQIFDSKGGAYREIANFFGFYSITGKLTNGLRDLQIRSAMGAGTEQSSTLRFDGRVYR